MGGLRAMALADGEDGGVVVCQHGRQWQNGGFVASAMATSSSVTAIDLSRVDITMPALAAKCVSGEKPGSKERSADS